MLPQFPPDSGSVLPGAEMAIGGQARCDPCASRRQVGSLGAKRPLPLRPDGIWVEFHACDTPRANRFTIHVLAAVAENEAQAISARTKAALAAAKARGTVLGGDRGNLTDALRRRARKNSTKARQHQAVKRASDFMPIIEQLRGEGATSLRQIAATLTEHGIPAPRGGEWQAVQVQRVLALAGKLV